MALTSTTHDIGNFFWHSISLRKKSPLIHRFPSHETEQPYRWSNSLILRVPLSTFGVVLGKWQKVDRTEEEALLAALSGRELNEIPTEEHLPWWGKSKLGKEVS